MAVALVLAALPDVMHLLPIAAWWALGDGSFAAVRGYALASPGQDFSRPRIYEAVWEEPFVGDDAAVKTHVSNLRGKLREAAPALDPIETVWGLGYRLRAL